MKNFIFLALMVCGLFSANSIFGQTPVINITGLESEYTVSQDIAITATISSNGAIDSLCGMGYKVYKDNVAITTDISNYGSVDYSFNRLNDTPYNDSITQGEGMLKLITETDTIAAFTLGIFDTYCIDRNRPVNIEANFTEIGIYKFVLTLYTCENNGIANGTTFIANPECGGAEHSDSIAKICENPTTFATKEFEINVVAAPDEITIINQSESTSICEGESTNISVNAIANNSLTINYKWFKDEAEFGNTTNSISVDEAGNYYCELTAGTASITSDTISITYHPTPTIALSPETPISSGETVILNPGEFTHYLWSDASTEPTLSVTEAGNYSVTVTNEFGCTASATTQVVAVPDEITITEQSQSTSICEGSSITISVTATTNSSEEIVYQWFRNGNAFGMSNSITVDLTGKYYCVLTAGSASVTSDTINITYSIPSTELNAETPICSGQTAVLNPGDFVSYEWSDTSTEPTLTVSELGEYSVTITDEFGCTATATTQVVLGEMPEEFSFTDTTICYGMTHALEGPFNDTYTYLWNTEDTTYSIIVDEAGTYALTVTNALGCQREGSVTIDFEYTINPQIAGGEKEIHACSDIPNIRLGPITEGTSWAWSTGSSSRTIRVSTPGVYSVTATDATGCYGADTIELIIHQIPEINLGGDQQYCAEEILTLTVDENDCEYAWNTGADTQSLTIEESGFYAVTVTDAFGCWAKDSVIIEIYPMPIVDLGDDFEMYENQTAILSAGYGCISYEWSLGPAYTEHFVKLSAENLNFGTNVISVTAKTINGCEDSDQVTVIFHEGVNADIEKTEMFYVYPNPTTGIVKINGENIKNVSLFDALGRMILSTESNTIDMSSYADGNYTLKISTQDNSYVTKIVKQ